MLAIEGEKKKVLFDFVIQHSSFNGVYAGRDSSWPSDAIM